MFAFILCLIAGYVSGFDISIIGGGKNAISCLQGNASIPCKTLNYVEEHLGQLPYRNISITIQPYKKWAKGNLSFKNLINFTLKSENTLTLRGRLLFRNISGLYIRLKCLKSRKENNKPVKHSILLSIEYCQNVTIQDTLFANVVGTAIFLRDNFGIIILINLMFTRNVNFESRSQIESHSGGLEIVSSIRTPAKYRVFNCTFEKNTAPHRYQSYSTTNQADSEWRGHSLGGALSLYFQEDSSNQDIMLVECNFVENKAHGGGGIHVLFQGMAVGNILRVMDSNFTKNSASGGGGVCIRYFKQVLPDSMYNRNIISFTRVMFVNNEATFGGGSLVLSTHNPYPSDVDITFSDCHWQRNSAVYGSAVVVSPALFQLLNDGILPVAEFLDCQVKFNSLKIERFSKSKISFSDVFAGIFIITKATVRFSGETTFEQNEDSALYLNSGTVVFNSSSKVRLCGNAGFRGSGITLLGYSSVLLNQNTTIIIESNSARSVGGAIYYHTEDQHDLKSGRLCFIRHESPIMNKDIASTIHIQFINNSAGILGQSIYSNTLYPCHFFSSSSVGINNTLSKSIFDFIGNVSFDNAEDAISTSSLTLNNTVIKSEYKTYPGGSIQLSLIPVDEFGKDHQNIHSYQVETSNKRILIDQQFTIRGKLNLAGAQGAKDVLKITQQSLRKLTILVNISLLYCPPGFYFDGKRKTCACTTNGSSQYFYYGISSCDINNFHASLHAGFWMGYVSSTNLSPTNLFTATCPVQFCQYHIPEIKLSSNRSELNNRVCRSHRTGILCGDCEPGYSPFFHSQNSFKCGKNTLCSYGILFYVLSELFPVTVLFTTIILLDLRFTSGGINGFIFYSQVLESLLLRRKQFDDRLNKALIPSKMFYDIFNFDFFSISSLSFCLWKNAKIIDIVAFKYITVLFALVLVIVVILILKKVKWNKLERVLKVKKRISVINGISAFLILCYSQCIKTSFYILTPAQLRTQGGTPGDLVTVFGGSLFFSGRHLLYSVVAILCIFSIIVIPPLILLSYPTLLHILALCRFSEHWIINRLLSLLMINRLKPLIDSFQSCYRDKVRLFSGLYFVYRIVIFSTFSIAHSTAQYHIVTQLSLSVFLGIHCAVQPYKEKSHNVLDSVLLLLLVMINGCTIFTDVYDVQYRDNYFYGANTVQFIFLSFQVILIYLPMLAFVGRFVLKMVRFFFKNILLLKKHETEVEEDDAGFPLEYRKLASSVM